eukprot:9124431-Alexandrium_andersonii.AAC.1
MAECHLDCCAEGLVPGCEGGTFGSKGCADQDVAAAVARARAGGAGCAGAAAAGAAGALSAWLTGGPAPPPAPAASGASPGSESHGVSRGQRQ